LNNVRARSRPPRTSRSRGGSLFGDPFTLNNVNIFKEKKHKKFVSAFRPFSLSNTASCFGAISPPPLAWRKEEEKYAFNNPIQGLFAATIRSL